MTLTTALTAYYNWGRWVADCPCNSGLLIGKGAGVYRCKECGSLWPVAMDPESAIAERTVAGRPAANRNWRPGEPITSLIMENLEHGIASDWEKGLLP